jgi:4-cresol dehydrogenase (hydroxylating)
MQPILAPISPPDVSEADFSRAIEAWIEAIGADNVLTGESVGQDYRDPYAVEPGSHQASAALLPGSTEDVQAIVRIANQTGVPLHPISRGKNNAYGGAGPRVSGAVIVDLGHRMNKVLEVNDDHGYAIIEPGVTYFDLHGYLKSIDSRHWIDVPDLGWGSVLGNATERGRGYTPYGDHFGMQCGFEVVLPDGDVMRTGMGAMQNSTTWSLFPYGFGPGSDPLFTQSNFGIVTKMGIQLMPAPPHAETFLVTFDSEDDLERIIDTMFPLRETGVFHNTPLLRNIVLDAAAMTRRSEWHEGTGPLPREVIERIKKELNLGYWNLYFTLYGTRPTIDAAYGQIKEAFSQIPRARFHTRQERTDPRGGHVLHDRHKINTGNPSMDEVHLVDWIGPHGGHIDFSPVSAPIGKETAKQAQMVRARAEQYGFDYVAQVIVGPRAIIHACLVLFDTADPEDQRKASEVCHALIKEAAAEGYGEYRTHTSLMDAVAATFNWNDGALARFNNKLKDCLDPNGILAPGKSGIWPKRYRGRNL